MRRSHPSRVRFSAKVALKRPSRVRSLITLKRPSRVSARIFAPLTGQKSDTRIFASVRANSPAIREARFARRVGIGVPHGLAPLTGPITTHTPPSRVRLSERTYPPEGGERRSPIYIRGSFARTRREFRV